MPFDIQVSKDNEVHLTVHAEPHVSQEICDYFTFFANGYQFVQAYKDKHWDGKIRLFSLKTHKLPIGLFRYLIDFARSRKYTIDFDPGMELLTNFSLQEAEEYIDSLHINSSGKRLQQREYQITAFAKAIRYHRTTLVSPTASGKSYMIYCIMNWILDSDPKARERGAKKRTGLIIVPTTSLVEQMFSDFVDYATPDGPRNMNAVCQKIYEGHSKEVTGRVVISTWQSIYNISNPKFFEQFDFVIGDEAHMFAAPVISGIMERLVNASYRIGTTGTMDDLKVNKLTVEGWFGPVCKTITTRELIDKGYASDVIMKCLILRHPPNSCHMLREQTTLDSKHAYRREIKFLIGCSTRNKFIANLALSLKGNTLLLFQYVENHGQLLYDLIKSKAGRKRKVFFIFGGTETEEREAVRSITEKEKDAIIVASYGVFSTGINIRNLHNVIFGSPSKGKRRVLQSIGRSLRLGDNKTHATVFDISDDMRIDDYINTTLNHYVVRYKLYSREKFKVIKYNIDLQS